MGSTLSDDLRSLKMEEGHVLSLQSLLEKAGDKGLLLLIILLNSPFLLPIPLPNLSTPFGIALLAIGSKLIWGVPKKLPNFVGKRLLQAKTLNTILETTIRGFEKIEKRIHPRYPLLTEKKLFIYLNFFLLMGMAFILTLPLGIPFTNFFPAWTIILLALGMLEKDGLLIILGYFFAAFTLLFLYLIYLFGAALLSWGKEFLSRF